MNTHKFSHGQKVYFFKERKIQEGIICYIRTDERIKNNEIVVDIFYHVNTTDKKVFVCEKDLFISMSDMQKCMTRIFPKSKKS